ncbi:unnamed protein product [Closterium sp. NIES-53]
MLLISAAEDVLGRVKYTGRVLCTDLRPCTATSTMAPTTTVALRTIATAMKSTPTRWHVRLAHDGVATIRSSAKHEVATGLEIKPSADTDSPCVSCIGGKLARHTFPDKGFDADDALTVVHIDLCGPFRVAAKDGSLYFLLLKDRKTCEVWVRLVAKKSNVLREFEKWLVMAERQTKKSVLMLRSNRGGEILGEVLTDFVDGKGIVHHLTCPDTPQKNGMAEREMRTVVEPVRTMLLHMDVQHHWWHIALRQAVWVRNFMERSTLSPETTLYQLLTGKKPDLMLAHVWGCVAQFLVPEQQRGGKLKPKARWGLHLGVSEESKGWELLDLTNNRVITMLDVVFYETMSLVVWKSEHGPASGRTQANPPTDTLTATLPLLAEVAYLHVLISTSASGDEGSSGASPVAPAKGIVGGRRDVTQVGVGEKSTTTGEQQAEEVQPTLVEPVKEASAGKPPTGEQPAVKLTKELSVTKQSAGKPTTGEK